MSSVHANRCFLVMPYRAQLVKTADGTRNIDFDEVYEVLFRPALDGIGLPEGGALAPWRSDQASFSGVISPEMYSDLEYSRLVVVDISCLNANVFYELGIRHHARSAGTVLFRQCGVALPFDIKDVRVFEYAAETPERLRGSVPYVRKSVVETLAHGAIDSPVRVALAAQEALAAPGFQDTLRRAEQALQANDRHQAISLLRAAAEAGPVAPNVRLRLALLLRDEGLFDEALGLLRAVAAELPDNPDVLRERGIVENKLWHRHGRPAGETDGEASLRAATKLAPDDFDAWSSLGGVLRRAGRLDEALRAYLRASDVSRGHPYPLLNAIKLEAKLAGRLEIDPKRRFQLRHAEGIRAPQAAQDPPWDAPWSLFDLAEIRLYLGNETEFLKLVTAGAEACREAWQPRTFRDTLQLLLDAGITSPVIADAMRVLQIAESALSCASPRAES